MAAGVDVERLVTDYCRAWFDPAPSERRRLLESVFEPDGRYVDPGVEIAGREALLTHIDAVLAARPGFALERLSAVDRHHDMLRFSWRRVGAGGFAGPECIDVCRLSAEGRLALVVGFFGPLQPQGR